VSVENNSKIMANENYGIDRKLLYFVAMLDKDV